MGRSQRHMVIIQGTDSAGKGLSEKQPAIVYIRQFAASQAFTVPLGPPSGPLKGSSLAGFPPTLFPAPGLDEQRSAELQTEGGQFTDSGQFNLSGNPKYASLPPPEEGGGAGPVPPDTETKPVLNSIDPSSAQLGDPDVTMTVNGGKFVDGSVIVFNGGDEPTTFVGDLQLTTVVRPSTASAAIGVPVWVRNPDGQRTDAEQTFTFIDPLAEPEGGARTLPAGPFTITLIEDHLDGIAVTLADGDVRVGDAVLIEATGNTSINGAYTVLSIDGQTIVVDNDVTLDVPIEAKGRLTVNGEA